MSTTAPATVLFDLDGTLCRHDQEGAAVLAETFERAGVEPFCTDDQLWDAADEVGDAESDHRFLSWAFEIAARRHGEERHRAAAPDLARAFETVIDHEAVSFRPGAERALSLAAEVGPVGLVTNGSEATQTVKLEALAIDGAFETVVYAGDLTRPKPAAEPFERALDALDARPTETLYVGNSLRHDVAGAQGAGLSAAWFPEEPGTDPGEHAPDFTFETLADLAAVLDGG